MKAVLFDLEGTLVESIYQRSPEKIHDLREETRECLIGLGVPEMVLAGLLRSSSMRNSAYRWVEENRCSGEAVLLKEQMEDFMSEYDMASACGSRLYPDTIRVLKTLWEGDVLMAIVTNTSTTAAYNILGRLGLGRYFATVITRSDILQMKPNPAMVRLAEERMAVKAGWLVGDAPFDAGAARAAGIPSIIVRRDGVRPDFEHDYFIDSLDALPPLLGL
ncbi:MAG: HAD-IA family hydrolase [Candidatus Bathyarchaeota archaeon]